MFLACHTMHEPFDNVWLFDNGYDNHMIGNKNLVVNLDQSMKTQVKLGTDKTMDVDGKGVVKIITKQGEEKTISESYYVLGLKHNLISVGQLMQKGHTIIFEGQECVIYNKPQSSELIVNVHMVGNKRFPLIMNYSDQVSSFTLTCSNDCQLCNIRLGHLHFFGLRLLQWKQMVRGLPPIKEPSSTCEYCILGKQHMKVFQRELHIEQRSHQSWYIQTYEDTISWWNLLLPRFH